MAGTNRNHNDNDGDNNDDDEEEEQQQPEERVTAESYGALDTHHVMDECWLIRIPQKLAELWERIPEGTELGDLVFTKGGSSDPGKGAYNVKPPTLTVHVAEEIVEQYGEVAEPSSTANKASTGGDRKPAAAPSMMPPPAIPLNYSLQAMTKKVPVLHPIVRNPRNGSVQLQGTVSRTANLQVEKDNIYRALLKDRLVATSVTSSRYVKPVESTESVMNKQQTRNNASMASASGRKSFGDAVFQYGKRLLEASQEGSTSQQQQALKKVRQFSSDQPLKSVVFELFAQQPFWTVKDLKAAAAAGGATTANTKKGEAEIRDVLREIAKNHRSGDHKNMWELRNEFQQQK